MGRSFQNLLSSAFTIVRILIVDCAVPLLFILIVTAVAQTIGVLMGIALSGEKLDTIVKARAAYFTTGVVAYSAILAACLIRLQPIKQSFRSSRSMIVAVSIGLFLLVVNLAAQHGKPNAGLELSISAALMILDICLLTPVAEELFWRGYLWARLQARGRSDGLITICTAILFVAVHLPGDIPSFVNYALMGLSFSLIRYFSGGIGLPIFFHAAMNFIVIRHIGV
ncbi:CPBP family intramembrane glutamic endopeptidase [Rhizobium rhizoryzae]|jgi:membrane protease YdiL (CAAX protease family)|uniref:CPBP family intramembrane glutamic endopeptidase n=1 Tax=Rhizobium rhizoryzae TaxID=451876 RepID=UPI00289728BE|nr:CPBP family intramembrane glutamic endopeptidase [Rhizobium rhizoryzae]